MVNALELFENFKNNQAKRALIEEQLRLSPLREEVLRFGLAKDRAAMERDEVKLGLLSRRQDAQERFDQGRLGVMAQANMIRAQQRPRDTGPKAPSGYRLTPDGSLEPIPGGPADQKAEGVYNQDTSALNSSLSGLERLEQQAKLVKGSNLGRITGVAGMLPNVPGYAGADAAGRLKSLKDQVGMNVLQALKDASRTSSSGLGQITEKEHVLLQTQLGNLDTAQSEQEVRRVLDDIENFSKASRERIRGAYNLKHSSRSKGGNGGWDSSKEERYQKWKSQQP